MAAHFASAKMTSPTSVAPDLRELSSFTLRMKSSTKGHYSVGQFLDLHHYIQQQNVWRAACTIVGTPVLGLIAAVIPAFLPLEPLHKGPTPSFMAHFCCMSMLLAVGALSAMLAVMRVPSTIVSRWDILAITVVSTGIHLGIASLLWHYWRFPVPFHWVIGTWTWVSSLSVANFIVLGRKCWSKELLAANREYGPAVMIETAQVVLYPAISVVFDHASETGQIIITLAFPVVKHLLKRSLVSLTSNLHDQHGVVVVAAVEVCSSLYQSMIMQSAPSMVAMGIVMAFDAIQGYASIKYHLDLRIRESRSDLINQATVILRHSTRHSSKTQLHSLAKSSTAVVNVAPAVVGGSKHLTYKQRSIVREALRSTQVAETILLVEYFEVVVPLINAMFLMIVANLKSTFFNTKLAVFYKNPARLESSIRSIMLYTVLQGVSWIVIYLILKHRYRMSPIYHLAFVLERHRVAIVSKMVAWLPLILHFMTVHYGVYMYSFVAIRMVCWRLTF